MALSIFVPLCFIATFTGARAATPLQYGMTMASRAYDAVCWYEALKVFPETHTDLYGECSGQAKQIQDQIDNPTPGNKAYMDASPDNALKMYGKFMGDMNILDSLPNGDYYSSSCNEYLTTPKANPSSDQSDALRDKNKNSYPYKALAYCLMEALKKKHGDKAIQAVKAERTHALKHWMQTLLDRENEFRARHGAEPLKLIKDLNDAAQEWSETNAKECNSYHSEDDSRLYRGKATGESLSAFGGKEDDDAAAASAAYIAADGWYEEIKDYPYPDGYQGDGNDELFEKIGHFTQSVWKDTKYVGYGYAFNKDCSGFTSYITARYFPAGNMAGEYTKNVSEPK